MSKVSPEINPGLISLIAKFSTGLDEDQIKQAVQSLEFGEWHFQRDYEFRFIVNTRFHHSEVTTYFERPDHPHIKLITHKNDAPMNVCGTTWGRKHYFYHHRIDSLEVREYKGQSALVIGLSLVKPETRIAGWVCSGRFKLPRRVHRVEGVDVPLAPTTVPHPRGDIWRYGLSDVNMVLTGTNIPIELVPAQEIIVQANGQGLVVNR